jgi:hypothetical protein
MGRTEKKEGYYSAAKETLIVGIIACATKFSTLVQIIATTSLYW